MITHDNIDSLYGYDVYDRTDDKVGSIGAVWTDGSGNPAWASVRTGWFGLRESLVPLRGAELRGDRVVVPFEKAHIKNAPDIDAESDEPLTSDEVTRLYEHYSMNWSDEHQAYRGGGYVREDGDGLRDDAMTRSEERLTVDTETEQVGRARLRKYVVAEKAQVTVPVSHEEVRIDREPITEANRARALDGPDITESEHEVRLYAERPVVETQVEAVERVRLAKETVTEEQTVGGQVRKEHIEADLPDGGRRAIG
ncbi:PRC and DUF2382 domain-containing protein [Actinoplanes sp. NPDC023801]|uniref:PRC and DUF2382 domain-containing protein n=1 Tax=Actinoplanes sp. NPDC023801 TaxID=3154595 RepID=UPI0034098888